MLFLCYCFSWQTNIKLHFSLKSRVPHFQLGICIFYLIPREACNCITLYNNLQKIPKTLQFVLLHSPSTPTSFSLHLLKLKYFSQSSTLAPPHHLAFSSLHHLSDSSPSFLLPRSFCQWDYAKMGLLIASLWVSKPFPAELWLCFPYSHTQTPMRIRVHVHAHRFTQIHTRSPCFFSLFIFSMAHVERVISAAWCPPLAKWFVVPAGTVFSCSRLSFLNPPLPHLSQGCHHFTQQQARIKVALQSCS